jgi:O-acetyl-ADP-ribose deacetylase (regulator of RNase III)
MEKQEERRKLMVNGKSLSCRPGDIAESSADAIVNAANNHLWMGSGVAGAIKRKGGQVIEDEAVNLGPIQVGDVAVTRAGKLKAKHVIHAAVMGQDLRTSEEYIRNATRKCLDQAEKLRLQSLDFPALGTGVGGFPMKKCAEIMLTESLIFLKSNVYVKNIGFVLFDENSLEDFTTALQKIKGLL